MLAIGTAPAPAALPLLEAAAPRPLVSSFPARRRHCQAPLSQHCTLLHGLRGCPAAPTRQCHSGKVWEGVAMPKKAKDKAEKLAKLDERQRKLGGSAAKPSGGGAVLAMRVAMGSIIGFGVLTSGAFDWLFEWLASIPARAARSASSQVRAELLDTAVEVMAEHPLTSGGTLLALAAAPVGQYLWRKHQLAAEQAAKLEQLSAADAEVREGRIVRKQAKVDGKVRARELAEEERTSWILEQRDYEKRRSEVEAHRALRRATMERQLEEVARKRAEEISADRAQAEEIAAKYDAEKMALEDLLAVPDPEDWPEVEEDDDEEGEAEAGQGQDDSRVQLQLETHPLIQGTRISLGATELVRLATVQPEAVHVALACCRCDQAADAQLSGIYEGENEARMWCGHCSALLSVTLRPALVHESSDVLGYIDTTNCRAVDCTAALLLATCLECFSTLRLPPFVRNRRLERTCEGATCHTKVAFKAARLQLEELTPPKQVRVSAKLSGLLEACFVIALIQA